MTPNVRKLNLPQEINHANLQLRQAMRAVELYIKVFLKLEPSVQTAAAPDEKEAQIQNAEKACNEMRDLIRVRHYSYRTEQTYLDWVSRYMGYALNHDLDWQKSDSVRRIHDQDLAAGHGAVYLPFALDRKYPAAPKEFGWQYLFPANDLAVDPRSGVVRRHHVSDQVPQRIMREAVRNAGIDKPASIHCLRHYAAYAELGISGIHSPLICSSKVSISARFRSIWGMKAWKPQDLHPRHPRHGFDC